MSIQMFLRICIIGFLLVLSIFFVSAKEIELTVEENADVIELLSGSYSIDVSGRLEIYNPSNSSQIYETIIPLSINSQLGFNLRNVEVESNKTLFDASFEEIKGRHIQPNETVILDYSFYGITPKPMHKELDKTSSFFKYYTQNYSFLSRANLNVLKPEREGVLYNDSGQLEEEENNESQRLVSAKFSNPTDFTYIANTLKLYKTVGSASLSILSEGDLLTIFSNKTIFPYETIELDFFDKNSVDDSIYWLSSDFSIKHKMNESVSIDFSKEKPPEDRPGGGGGFRNYVGSEDEIDTSLLIRKSSDKSVVTRGDEVNVFLTIVNNDEQGFTNLTVEDTIPRDFILEDVSESFRLSSNSLKFNIDELEGFSSETIKYTLINERESQGVTYLQPAKLLYQNFTFYSEGVMLINELLPDSQLFVQKEVSYVDDGWAEVTLKIRNIGSVVFEDLLIVESISDDALIRGITKEFEIPGEWTIERLSQGGQWEVTYQVERHSGVDSLPNIYGVDQNKVFGVIISSEEVVTILNGGSRVLERVGLGVSLGLLLLYILF